MPVDTARPDDLIPLPEAAALVDRSVSSLRSWVRAGRLVKWREDPDDTGSRVLVSRAELLALAARDLDPTPGRPARRPPTDEAALPGDLAELAKLRAELEGARLVLEATREHLAELRIARGEALVGERQRAEAERSRADAERARADALAAELVAAREELSAARAERDALRGLAGLPWWRRLLPLPGPTAD